MIDLSHSVTDRHASVTTPSGEPTVGAVSIIFRKELRELLRDARFWWTSGIMLVILFMAFLIGWREGLRVDAEQAVARNVTYQQWLDQEDKNPHKAAHFGQYGFKPISPLSFFDPGVDPYVGVTVWIEAHKQNEFNFRPARDMTSLQRFSPFSMAFGLQILVPLIIVLLAFSAFTGERERGTLRQLLSIGVQPWQLLAGKGLAIIAVIGALLLPAGLLGAIALGFSSHDHVSTENLFGRGLWLIIGYTLYIIGFTALTLGVSAAVSSSRKALIVLLAFWVVNSFIAPRVVTDLARKAIPTPTAVEFQTGLIKARKDGFSADDTHPAFIAFRDRLLKQYAVTRVEDLPVSFRGLSLRHDDESGYRVFDQHYGALFETYAQQERMRAIAGIAFPLSALQLFSMGMSGTDTAHHNQFAIAAEGYRREIQTKMSEDLILNHKNGDKNYVASSALWKTIRPFYYQIPEMKWALVRQILNLAMLLVWTFAVTVFSVTATKRLRPTI